MIGTTPTVQDVKDLIAAKDYGHQQLDQAYATFAPLWSSSDATSFVAWTNAWQAQSQRYQDARSNAQTAVTLADLDPTPDALIPAQGAYDGILVAEKSAYPNDIITPGDFDDLSTRLTVAANQWGGVGPSYPDVPQPSGDPDQKLLEILPDIQEIPGLTTPIPTWVKVLGATALMGFGIGFLKKLPAIVKEALIP